MLFRQARRPQQEGRDWTIIAEGGGGVRFGLGFCLGLSPGFSGTTPTATLRPIASAVAVRTRGGLRSLDGCNDLGDGRDRVIRSRGGGRCVTRRATTAATA